MAFWSISRKVSGVLGLTLAVTLVLSAVPSVQAQIPDITVDVAEVFAIPGATAIEVPIYLSNTVDSISGYNLWIQLDRPDLVRFRTVVDTIIDTTYWICDVPDGENCLDSTKTHKDDVWDFLHVDTTEVYKAHSSIDSAGTLCSGWDMVDASSISGVGTDVNIAGMVLPDPENPDEYNGIPSGQQGGVLIKLVLDVLPTIPDWETDRKVTMMIQTDFKDHFGFSRPNGTSIGWTTQDVEDYSCWDCIQWGPPPYEDVCMMYNEISYISPEFCDSVGVEIIQQPILDTVKVKIFDGSLTALIPPPPVLDAIGPQTININNATLLSFGVSASDPDETIPWLIASPLPEGATFADNGDGTGDFDWTVDVADVGLYEVMFYAYDAVTMGIDSELVNIEVSDLTYTCGNVDGLQPPRIDVADLVFLVHYMFHEGPPPPEGEGAADVDCNGRVDVSDLVFFVKYMFQSGPDICDGC